MEMWFSHEGGDNETNEGMKTLETVRFEDLSFEQLWLHMESNNIHQIVDEQLCRNTQLNGKAL